MSESRNGIQSDLRSPKQVLFIAILLSIALRADVGAQSTPPNVKSNSPALNPADSDDDELTKGILDELLPVQPEQGTEMVPPSPALEEELSEILSSVQRDLSLAAQMMRRSEPAPRVLQLQDSIVIRMEELIKKLKDEIEQQQKNNQSSMKEQSASQRQNSMQQQKQSSSRILPESIPNEVMSPSESQGNDSSLEPSDPQSGSTELGLMDRIRMGEGVWGHLPERTRRESISSGSIRFVPKYEKMLQQYYRKLSSDPPQQSQPPK